MCSTFSPTNVFYNLISPLSAMQTSSNDTQFRNIILVFFALKLLIHLYTNAFAGYGIFRDELYLYACTLRPDIGYVDQPPLSIWVLKAFTYLFGKSVFAIRFIAAFFGALALVPLGLAIKELGGGKISLIIASLAFVISPIYLAYCGYYSMNSIDLFLWGVAIYLLIRLRKRQDPRTWIWLGITMGLALMNKIGMLWFGFGLLISLITTKERHWLTTKWPYLAGGIAFLVFLPYVVWNALHGWPTIEFLSGAADKYSSQNQLTFLAGQLLINNPANIIVWISGILYFVAVDKKRDGLQLFIIFLTILTILLINGHTKPEYLSPIFMVLYIGGGLAIEKWTVKRRWIAYLVIANQALGFVATPLAIPILPVEKYMSFSQALGMAPSTSEGHELTELPQFYADMFGWENQAKAIAKAYHSLSDEEKSKCAIFGDNYGRSGTVDYYADKYDLPLSIGRHNNYWIWGPGHFTGELMIILSDEVGDKDELFEEVTEVGTVYTKYAMPYENNLKVYICRDLKIRTEDLWPKLKSYN
jgi:hypothetical protein